MKSNKDLQRMFTSTLISTARQWRKSVDQTIQKHGVSEACAAPLICIGRLGGGVRQIALAQEVGIEGASLVRLLDQLEALNLVVRRDDPADRRAKGLWLTDEGERIAGELEAVLDNMRGEILARIEPTDLEAAIRVLKAFDRPAEIDVAPTERKAG